MKPRQLLLLAIPLVAALAFLIFRGSLNGPESTTPPPLAPSSGPAAAGARDPSTLGAREVAEDSAGEARTAADTAALSPPGDAAGSAEPVVWSGRVIDPAGNPLREARVKLIKDRNVHRTPGVIWNRAGAEAVVESVCDAKGRFRLEQSGDPGPLQIVAYQTGFQVFHGAAKERELGDLVLEPGMVLGGFVLSSSGVPVAGARVRRLAENRGPSPFFFDFGRWMNEEDKLQPGEVLTDEDGRFEFPHEAPGAYRLEARHRQHPSAEIEGQGREGEVLEEHIVLPRAASVSGSVAGVPAETDAELRVLARRVRSAEEQDKDQGDGARFFPGGGN